MLTKKSLSRILTNFSSSHNGNNIIIIKDSTPKQNKKLQKAKAKSKEKKRKEKELRRE